MEKTIENTKIVCTLNEAEFRERRTMARRTILPQVVSYKRIKDGLSIKFLHSPRTLSDVKEFIRLEQGCCGFLTFNLTPEPISSNELLELMMTGPPGATEFIDIFIQLVENESNAYNKA